MLPEVLGYGTLRLLVQALNLSVGLKSSIQECVKSKVSSFSPQVSLKVGREAPTYFP